MLKTYFIPFVFLLISFNSFSQTIDGDNSKVSFTLKSFGFNTVNGSFSGMKGAINFQPDDLSSANFKVCIDANTINTGINKRDDHLKKEDFFDVANYPEICFVATQIEKTNEGYKTTGTLTMRGVEKTIEIPFTFKNNQLIGNFKVKRLDYKVGEGTGGLTVGKEIKIKIVCVLN